MSKGTVAMVRADYASAQTEFERALSEAQDQYDANDERTLRTIGLLGQTYYKLGNFDKAGTFLSQSTKSTSGDTLSAALDLLSLAAIDRASGNATDANRHAQKAIGMLRPAGQENAAQSVCELEQLFALARRNENDDVHTQFHALLITAGGKQHRKPQAVDPSVVELLKRWQIYMDLGRHHLQRNSDESDAFAYRQFHEATHLAYRLFQHDHVNIASCLSLLGATSMRLKMYDQAEAHLKRAAQIYSSANGYSSDLARVKLNLATLYSEIADYRQALDHLTEAAEILERTSPFSDKKSAQMYQSMLAIMTRAELYTTAREIIRQAIEAEESESFEQALNLYDRTLALLRGVFPADHLEIAQVLHFKSAVLRRLGDNLAGTGAQREAEKIEHRIEKQAQKWERMVSDLPPFAIPPSHAAS
jgi:tetratricopeptide (TPR) repeat protein